MNLRQKYKKLKKDHERLKTRASVLNPLQDGVGVNKTNIEFKKVMSVASIPVGGSDSEKKYVQREIAYDIGLFMMDNGYIDYSEELENNSINSRLRIVGRTYVGREQ